MKGFTAKWTTSGSLEKRIGPVEIFSELKEMVPNLDLLGWVSIAFSERAHQEGFSVTDSDSGDSEPEDKDEDDKLGNTKEASSREEVGCSNAGEPYYMEYIDVLTFH